MAVSRFLFALVRPVYDRKLWDVLGVSAYYVREYEVGRDAARRALAAAPRDARMRANLAFYTRKLHERPGSGGGGRPG